MNVTIREVAEEVDHLDSLAKCNLGKPCGGKCFVFPSFRHENSITANSRSG